MVLHPTDVAAVSLVRGAIEHPHLQQRSVSASGAGRPRAALWQHMSVQAEVP